ncbi:MAG: glycosyltransferase [Gordonia sp. (in: high G+C Gram-positive bacteria)]
MPTDVHERRHVLLVSLNYTPEQTGIAPYVTGASRMLTSNGHRVSVITGIPHYPEWRKHKGYRRLRPATTVIDDVTVTRVPHYVPRRPGMVGRMAMELSFAFWILVLRLHRPDVVLCTSPSLFGSLVARIRTLGPRGAAFGVWVHDFYGLGSSEIGGAARRISGVIDRVEIGLLRRADGVAVIHDRFKMIVEQRMGQSEKTIVIRNWSHMADMLDDVADGDRIKAREALHWPPGCRVVLHAGNMGQKQGLENVIETAELIARDREAELLFVLLGDGNTRRDLERQAAGLSTVRFMDPLPDSEFRSALRCADVLLVNERVGVKEMAVPSKLTTYFASGTPVVAAVDRDGITAQEIESTQTGVVVPSGDPQALVTSINRLLDDPAMCSRITRAAERHCVENLSSQAAADRFERWIDLLIAASTSVRSG